MYRIWVGKRESDILTYEYFDASITFYGSNENGNYSFCTKERKVAKYSYEFVDYTIQMLEKLITAYSEVEVHFYNSIFAYKILNKHKDFEKYFVNLNSLDILDVIRHKTLSRAWLTNVVNTPAFCLLSKNECSIENLKRKFGEKYDAFIIQKNFSGGGKGTFLLDYNTQEEIFNLKSTELYLVSPCYIPNTSYSCHFVIDDINFAIFPISEQKIYTENSKFEYCGNSYSNLNQTHVAKIKASAAIICKQLQSIGYRGVGGLDFIFAENTALFIEINPRYQGSSFIINAALKQNNLPSLFEINSICFNDKISNQLLKNIEMLKVSVTNGCINYYNVSDISRAKKMLNSNLNTFEDGLNNATQFELGCYLLRYISSCGESSSLI